MIKRRTCKDRVRPNLESRMDDVRRLWAAYFENESIPDLGRFEEYGLAFDFVAMGTFSDQTEPYFRWQLSTGGPGDEFRIFATRRSAAKWDVHRIEYWFLDWFDGAKVTLTGSDFELIEEIFDWYFVDAAIAEWAYRRSHD